MTPYPFTCGSRNWSLWLGSTTLLSVLTRKSWGHVLTTTKEQFTKEKNSIIVKGLALDTNNFVTFSRETNIMISRDGLTSRGSSNINSCTVHGHVSHFLMHINAQLMKSTAQISGQSYCKCINIYYSRLLWWLRIYIYWPISRSWLKVETPNLCELVTWDS